MKNIQTKTEEQARWNHYGKTHLQEIEENPAQHIIQISPIGHWTVYDELMMLISPIHDKEILELGCGLGRFSVFLAKQGAKVNGIDIGFDLIAASRALAKANQINCEFEQCNITTLPFDVDTYDIVLGLSVLHHLSRSDVENALRESWRVLKKGGLQFSLNLLRTVKYLTLSRIYYPQGKKKVDIIGHPY